MKKTCSGCEYWEEDYTEIKNVRRCTKPEMFWSTTEWVKDETGQTGLKINDEHKDLKMFVQDASDYFAKLLTREDFYCSHWEPKC